jgi:hypothetical protein
MADGSLERCCGFQDTWPFSGTGTNARATAKHPRVKVRSRRNEQEPFSAIDYCAKRSTAFVLDIVFGQGVEIE